MSEKHPIRNGVISTVVGGAILSGLSLVWQPAADLLALVGQSLTGTISVPVWSILLTSVGVVVVFLAGRRGRTKAVQPPAAAAPGLEALGRVGPQNSGQLGRPREFSLDHLQTQILLRLVKVDGEPVSVRSLLRATRASNVRMQAALERLEEEDIIEPLDDPADGDSDVRLTPHGRQYVVQSGLA